MQSTDASIHPNIAAYMPMLEGIVNLLYPYAEGAVHDLQKGQVIAIYNTMSKRKVGDPSPLTELGIEVKDFPDVFAPYYKTNWDGTKLKCTSITVRDNAGEPIGLLCLNFNTSAFETMHLQLGTFLGLRNQDGLNPIEQFAENWRQQITDSISEYAARNNIAPSALSKSQKSELVGKLYDHGLFNYRDAAAYIGQTLGVSRTTIYNYLKEK